MKGKHINNLALFTSLQYNKRIILMFLFFFIAVISTSVIIHSLSNVFPQDTRNGLLISSSIQNIIMFVLPAVATAFFMSTQPFKLLGLKRFVSWKSALAITLIMISAIPILNVIINWNNELHLPSSLYEIEAVMRSMENAAAKTTNIILNTSSISGLLVGILVIGVLTGFSEELFFRGTLQKVIASNGMNHHLAIWLSAIIFSILHFQFFGFVPRMLLGAFFGYIFYWTGSIWCSAFAHAFNNSIVVITSYLVNIDYLDADFKNFGTINNGIPYIAFFSLILTIVLIAISKKYFLNSKVH